MNPVLEILSGFFLLCGCFFCLTGALGMLRLRDLYSRTHGAGVIDGLGAFLVLLGLLLRVEEIPVAVRLILIFVFMLISGPTAVHSLARSALTAGVDYDLTDEESESAGEGDGSSNT